jgi:hypothetical protein
MNLKEFIVLNKQNNQKMPMLIQWNLIINGCKEIILHLIRALKSYIINQNTMIDI